MNKMTLPQTLEGHWSTKDGHMMAERYADQKRSSLVYGDKTDMEMGNAIFMVDRNSFDLIAMQTAAKERICWLSAQLALVTLQLVAKEIEPK